jgi:hypothetical protein
MWRLPAHTSSMDETPQKNNPKEAELDIYMAENAMVK